MLEEFHMFIPVAPVPKERPRIGRGGGRTPEKTKTAETVIRALVLEQAGGQEFPEDAPLEVTAVFYLTPPKNRKSARFGAYDLDNLLKLLLDAISGTPTHRGIIPNDRQVMEIHANKQVGHIEPSIHIHIRKMA